MSKQIVPGGKGEYAPWREASSLVMDGAGLVDLSTGYRYRTVNSCGSSGHATSSACASLNLARSLFGLGIAKAVLNQKASTAKKYAHSTFVVRAHVECRECNARTSWSAVGLPGWMPLFWLKSMERAKNGGTSITWRVELTPDAQEGRSATTVSERNINWLKEASKLQLGTGKPTLDQLTEQPQAEREQLRST